MSDDAPRRHGADLLRHAAGLGTVGTDGKVGELGYRMGVPILVQMREPHIGITVEQSREYLKHVGIAS